LIHGSIPGAVAPRLQEHSTALAICLPEQLASKRPIVGLLALPSVPGYDPPMATARLNDPIEPMTLGNMRANGVRSLEVSCWQCHHRAIMSAAPWADDVPVPTFGPRMACTHCGIIGADARPNWHEQPPRESLTGVQWRR
jgi:hypothetical protein